VGCAHERKDKMNLAAIDECDGIMETLTPKLYDAEKQALIYIGTHILAADDDGYIYIPAANLEGDSKISDLRAEVDALKQELQELKQLLKK